MADLLSDPGIPTSTSSAMFKPPYVAVIFASTRNEGDNGYENTADRMVELAEHQKGFLGADSVRDPVTTVGITVSYWRTMADVLAWKLHTEHAEARSRGRSTWYSQYTVRVAVVEREYGWHAPSQAEDASPESNTPASSSATEGQ